MTLAELARALKELRDVYPYKYGDTIITIPNPDFIELEVYDDKTGTSIRLLKHVDKIL